MKLFPILLLLCLPCIPANAQWKKISSGTFQDLYDIHINGKTGYIAGQASTVLKSTDSGRTWKTLGLTIPTNLRALYFFDSLTGVVTGENARIQKTTDGGKTWKSKYVRTAAYAYAITFQNKSGIAVGRDMLAVSSNDSGNTWEVDSTFKSGKKLNSVCITPDGTCWAVGDSGYILNKHISEKRWSVTKYPGRIDLNHVTHIGDSTIIVAGGMPDSTQVGVFHNIFLRSVNKGQQWDSIKIPEMKTINTGWFFTKDTGILAGSNGIISKTNEPFTKRGLQLSGTPSSLNRMFFSDGIGYIVGDGGVILHTTNRGGFGLGISPVQGEQTVNIYPNPGNGEFSISCEENIHSIIVSDVTGHTIASYGMGDTIIHIENKGIYMVTVLLENGVLIREKVVVD